MTIERIRKDTDSWIKYYANHIHRYKFAVDQGRKKEIKAILDIACGVGYGSQYLASNFREATVIGVDIDSSAIEEANAAFKEENLEYFLADVNELPDQVNKTKFDLVTCIETIEHLKEANLFLKKIFSLLSPGGVLIITTPNVEVTGHTEPNSQEFHEKEYTIQEFNDLLAPIGFSETCLYGQFYTSTGKLKSDIRHEINILRSNPFYRLGSAFQKVFRRRVFIPPLPETADDFEIFKLEAELLVEKKPFVIMGVCKK